MEKAVQEIKDTLSLALAGHAIVKDRVLYGVTQSDYPAVCNIIRAVSQATIGCVNLIKDGDDIDKLDAAINLIKTFNLLISEMKRAALSGDTVLFSDLFRYDFPAFTSSVLIMLGE